MTSPQKDIRRGLHQRPINISSAGTGGAAGRRQVTGGNKEKPFAIAALSNLWLRNQIDPSAILLSPTHTPPSASPLDPFLPFCEASARPLSLIPPVIPLLPLIAKRCSSFCCLKTGFPEDVPEIQKFF